MRIETRNKIIDWVVVESCFLSEVVGSRWRIHSWWAAMCETFKPVIKWLLFYAIFEVGPFEVWFCWSLGHQLKSVNVDVVLPHYTVLLICNTHADILCDTNSVSQLCQVYCYTSQAFPAHAVYTLCICSGCQCAWHTLEVTGLLFYHTAIMFCLHGISALGRYSRYAWYCLYIWPSGQMWLC